jgi:hypothetical protein
VHACLTGAVYARRSIGLLLLTGSRLIIGTWRCLPCRQTLNPARTRIRLWIDLTLSPVPWTQRQAFMNVSRSTLIVSACVVGMPCGKPL